MMILTLGIIELAIAMEANEHIPYPTAGSVDESHYNQLHARQRHSDSVLNKILLASRSDS